MYGNVLEAYAAKILAVFRCLGSLNLEFFVRYLKFKADPIAKSIQLYKICKENSKFEYFPPQEPSKFNKPDFLSKSLMKI